MRKILLSDVDGTFYFSNNAEENIRFKDIAAIKKFQKEGNLFGVCTGRSYAGLISALQNYSIKLDFMILSSGAVIFVGNEKIKEELLTKDILNIVFNAIDLKECGLTATSENSFYFSEYLHYTFSTAHKINALDDVFDQTFTNITIESNNIEDLEKNRILLLNKIGNIVEINRNENSLDISPKNCDKGSAINCIMNYYLSDVNSLYAIGDSFNDIPMFQKVKSSYTFNKSSDRVKEAADYLVDSLEECIYQILDK